MEKAPRFLTRVTRPAGAAGALRNLSRERPRDSARSDKPGRSELCPGSQHGHSPSPRGAGPHTGAGTGNSVPEGPGRGGGSAICAVSPAKQSAGPGRHLGSRRVTSPPLPSVRPPGRSGAATWQRGHPRCPARGWGGR